MDTIFLIINFKYIQNIKIFEYKIFTITYDRFKERNRNNRNLKR